MRCASVLSAAAVLLGFSSLVAHAAPPDSIGTVPFKLRNARGYVALAWKQNEIGRGFDGQSFLAGGDIVVLLPKMERGDGFELIVGGKGSYLGGDMTYTRVTHDAEWLGAKGEALFQAVDFGFKGCPLPGWPVEPYLSVGAGFKWLIVRDAAVKGGEVGDAKFTDFGWNVGGGVQIFPLARWMIEAAVVQSAIKYTAVTAVKGDWSPIDIDVDGGGLSYRAGLAYCFAVPR